MGKNSKEPIIIKKTIKSTNGDISLALVPVVLPEEYDELNEYITASDKYVAVFNTSLASYISDKLQNDTLVFFCTIELYTFESLKLSHEKIDSIKVIRAICEACVKRIIVHHFIDANIEISTGLSTIVFSEHTGANEIDISPSFQTCLCTAMLKQSITEAPAIFSDFMIVIHPSKAKLVKSGNVYDSFQCTTELTANINGQSAGTLKLLLNAIKDVKTLPIPKELKVDLANHFKGTSIVLNSLVSPKDVTLAIDAFSNLTGLDEDTSSEEFKLVVNEMQQEMYV